MPDSDLLSQIRSLPEFRGAHVAVRGNRQAQKLILGIGQMHVVLWGKISVRTARQIAAVQTWIFGACNALSTRFGVMGFGKEGLHGSADRTEAFRIGSETVQEIQRDLARFGSAAAYFRFTANAWQQALKFRDQKATERHASALDGLSLLQAVNPNVAMFPIEQTDVHSPVLAGVKQLSDMMELLQVHPAYRSARAKGGKNLTQPEYDAIVQMNSLAKQPNAMLAHPERDRALLREVYERATGPLTVFVLGQAHHRGLLRLAKQNIGSDALFVWVTPPALRSSRQFFRRLLFVGVPMIALILAVAAFFLR